MFADAVNKDFRNILNGEFSEDVTITASQTSITVRGIFDKTFLEVDPDTNGTVSSKKPRVTIWKADVSFSIKQGQLVNIKGKEYIIREPPIDDGVGCLTLYLE